MPVVDAGADDATAMPLPPWKIKVVEPISLPSPERGAYEPQIRFQARFEPLTPVPALSRA